MVLDLGLLGTEEEANTVLQNITNYVPSDTASYSRLELSVLSQEPQICLLYTDENKD